MAFARNLVRRDRRLQLGNSAAVGAIGAAAFIGLVELRARAGS
jgi:hypothetical protein